MKRIKTNKARDEFGSVVNRVAYGQERIILQRRNRDMAAMIPMEDLRLLERLIEAEEDRIDLEKAGKAHAERGRDIPLDQFMEVEAASWKGPHGLGTSLSCVPESEAFYRGVLANFGATNDARIDLLQIGGAPAAAQLAVSAGGSAPPRDAEAPTASLHHRNLHAKTVRPAHETVPLRDHLRGSR